MLLGHEAAGRVVEAGPGTTCRRHPVVMTFLPRCGECAACATDGLAPCSPGQRGQQRRPPHRRRQRLHRDGADVFHHLGSRLRRPTRSSHETSVVPVDDDIPAEIAAVLGCAVLTGGGAVMNAGRPTPGQTIAVVGLGGVGMAAVLTALARTAYASSVSTRSREARGRRRLGAHAPSTPDEAVEQGLKAEVVDRVRRSCPRVRVGDRPHRPRRSDRHRGLPAPTTRPPSRRSPWSRRDAPSSAATSARLSRAGTSPSSPTCGAPDGCRSSTSCRPDVGLDDINEGMDQLADGHAIRQVILFD